MYTDWNRQWPPNNTQWRHPGIPGRPSASFRGRYQRFDQPRPYFSPRPHFQPRNDNYWCETCDRGFATEDLLSKHMQQHQKCNIDGCQFIAHPKVITKHIQMQHSSGLYKKIANIHKPEDIEKWREERKKKYPTKANIDKKAAALKEKIERGEKMGLDRKRFHQNKDNSNNNRENRSGPDWKRRNIGNEKQPLSKFNRNNFTDNYHNRKRKPTAKPKVLPPVEDDRKLKPFTGISDIKMDSDNEVEEAAEVNDLFEIDEDDDLQYKSVHVKPVETTEPVVCGALSSLMCDYESSDDEDMEKNTSSDKIVDLNKSFKRNNVKDVIQNSTNSKQDNKNKAVSKSCKDLKDNPCSLEKVPEKSAVSEESKTSSVLSRPDQTIQSSNSVEIKHELESKEDSFTQHIDEDDSGPEEIKVIKKEDVGDATTTPSEELKPKKTVVRKRNVTAKKQPFRQPRPKLPSTLLQKLLYREMKQERNIILQCIRYIRRNDYFDKKE